MTIDQVAEHLGVPIQQLQNVIEEGRLRVVAPCSDPRIHEADFEDFLRDHRASALTGEIDRRALRSGLFSKVRRALS